MHFVIALSPLVLILLPKDFFDTGQTVCLSQLLAGIECYACGMTRAVMHFIHLDFETAWMFNKLSFIVVPMLVPMWVKSLLIVFKQNIPLFMKKYM
jgi:hypothetical protein